MRRQLKFPQTRAAEIVQTPPEQVLKASSPLRKRNPSLHWTEVVGPLLSQDHSLPLTKVSEKGAKEASGTWQGSKHAHVIGFFSPLIPLRGAAILRVASGRRRWACGVCGWAV